MNSQQRKRSRLPWCWIVMQMSENPAERTTRVCAAVLALRIHKARGVVSCMSPLPAEKLAPARRRSHASTPGQVDRCAGRATPVMLPLLRESVGRRQGGVVWTRDRDAPVQNPARGSASANYHAAKLPEPRLQVLPYRLSHKSSNAYCAFNSRPGTKRGDNILTGQQRHRVPFYRSSS